MLQLTRVALAQRRLYYCSNERDYRGMCHQVPLVEVFPKNEKSTLYAKVKPEDIAGIIATHFKPPEYVWNAENSVYKFFGGV